MRHLRGSALRVREKPLFGIESFCSHADEGMIRSVRPHDFWFSRSGPHGGTETRSFGVPTDPELFRKPFVSAGIHATVCRVGVASPLDPTCGLSEPGLLAGRFCDVHRPVMMRRGIRARYSVFSLDFLRSD